MEMLNRIKRAWNVLTRPSLSANDEELLTWLGIDTRDRQLISEVTYYTCMKMLSETIGKMPIKYYQDTEQGRIRADPDEVTRLLTVRPNPIMTPTTLWTAVEMNCQHYGNGYVWIRGGLEKNGSYGGNYKIKDLWLMQSCYVTVLMDDSGVFGNKGKIYYQYTDPEDGELYIFQSEEVMHFKTWYSLDGITGEPVRKILKDTVGGALESQRFMNKLYEQGLTASMAMQYTGDLDDDRVKRLKENLLINCQDLRTQEK